MRTSNVLASLGHIARGDYPGLAALPTVVEVLRNALGFNLAVFTWTDGHANVRDCHIVAGPDIRSVLHLYWSEYANAQEAGCVRSFRDVLLSSVPYDSSDLYRGRYQNSPLYHDIGRVVDCYHFMRWPIREAGRPLGSLFLSRPMRSRPFSEKEKTFMSRATGPMTHILARRDGVDIEADWRADSGDEGFVVCDSKGRVQHLSIRARTLLHLAAGLPADVERLGDNALVWAGPLLRQAADRLADTRDLQPCVYTLRNASGTYLFRSYRLHAQQSGMPEHLLVQISRHIPLALRMLATPKMHALPGRDQEVALLLSAGRSNKEISKQLRISANSVAYHVRSVFNRLNISRREDLARALLG